MVAAVSSLKSRPAPAFDPSKEYTASGGYFSSYVGAAIGQLFNEAEYALGPGGFEQMLTDPEVLKDVTLIVDAVLGDGLQTLPCYTDEKTDKAKADAAAENAELCRLNFDSPRKPFRETLREMMRGAYTTGHKISEQTWRDAAGPDGGPLLVLDTVKCKPRGAAAFVVDRFMNVLGIQVWTPEGARVVDRSKFFVLAFECRDEDPRGSAPQMRASYNYYVAKRAALPIRLKRLEKKAIPSTVGFTAPDEGEAETLDADGATVTKTATEVMAERLASLGDGNSSAAFPHEAKVQLLDASGDGAEFDTFDAMCDRQTTRAHLLQDLATNEGLHGTRAQASVQVDVLALRIWNFKNLVADAVRADVCRPFLALNREPEKAALVPVVTLGDSERRDWAVDAKAAAVLAPLVTDSIWESLVAMLGLPAKAEGEEWPRRVRQQRNPAANGDKEPDDEGEGMSLQEALALHASLASSIRTAERLRALSNRR